MSKYHQANMQLWQCRSDAIIGDYFCHNIIPYNADEANLPKEHFALLGFACDLGVERNFGRVGSSLGPDAIRKCLSRLTISQIKSTYDMGNIVLISKNSLLEAQKKLAKYVSKIVKSGTMPIVLGGGHETAYGHYLGLLEAKNADIAILNFDAHFDLRAVNEQNEGTSGTPFRQIYNLCTAQGKSFDYYCIGIQPQANVNSLYEFAKLSNTTYLEADEVNAVSVAKFIQNILSKHKYIYLSICLDVFHYSYAPGVSAPQALGINPHIVVEALRLLAQSKQVLSMDVVELNPNFDIDYHTARLAAMLIAKYCYFKE